MSTLLEKLIDGKDLQAAEAEAFLSDILQGVVPGEQLAAVLTAFRIKGEAPDEILGFIRAMRDAMTTIRAPKGAVDVCGTGGDGANTFNISTTVAFVVAGAGVPVAKHGNRAASSRSGSADVLEALGANIDLTPNQAQQVLQKAGMVFLFAPHYHPAMKRVAPVRKALGIPTVFNLLGPFANPASVQHQLVGVPNKDAAAKLAQVARQLPYQRLVIASNSDGLDEIGLKGTTTLYIIEGGALREQKVQAEAYGLRPAPRKAIAGGTAGENAAITLAILGGEAGPPRDIVVLNAGFALYAAQKVSTPEEGIEQAKAAIDSGAAARVLQAYVEESTRYA